MIIEQFSVSSRDKGKGPNHVYIVLKKEETLKN